MSVAVCGCVREGGRKGEVIPLQAGMDLPLLLLDQSSLWQAVLTFMPRIRILDINNNVMGFISGVSRRYFR